MDRHPGIVRVAAENLVFIGYGIYLFGAAIAGILISKLRELVAR